MLLSITGCVRTQAEEVSATLPLDNSLPASWQPLGNVREINLDQDPVSEYLLFFTYDGDNGPVGAVIYDNRLGDTIGVVDNESNRPSASLMPYPILPSYRTDGGQGFIAEPDQKDAIEVYPLTFQGNGTTEATTTDTVGQADVLAILGGTTYLTFVWWQSTQNTYGITQLYTPSHFEAQPFQPFDWTGWRAAPQPITEIISVHPVRDRNQLCYRRRHRLVAPDQTTIASGQPIAAIAYRESNLGLDFCGSAPSMPFYPEGVVLAYLLGNNTLLDTKIDDGARQVIQEAVMPQAIVYTKDLASYKTVRDTAADNAKVRVCAEVLRPGEFYLTHPQSVAADEAGNATVFEPIAPDSVPPHALQWLLFTLRHEPFRLDPPPPLPDRLFITSVMEIPVAARHIPLECKVQLGK